MIIVFMGVSGSGKTTLANRTASLLGCSRVLEADEYHSPEMKAKMASGVPLTDEDRWPWLARLNQAIQEWPEEICIATCSALKRSYRERLQENITQPLHFIFLTAPQSTIAERQAQRVHEFMSPTLVPSQFAALEIPGPNEPVIAVPVTGTVDETFFVIKAALNRLGVLRSSDVE